MLNHYDNVELNRWIIISLVTIICASIVSIAGVIGWVGWLYLI